MDSLKLETPNDNRSSSLSTHNKSLPLEEYGLSGKFVAQEIKSCLNLNPSFLLLLLRTNMTFTMLGGDSLAAARITRALYARHFDIPDSRELGGSFGVMDGPFAVIHLLHSSTLGDYVDFLDSSGVLLQKKKEEEEEEESLSIDNTKQEVSSLPSIESTNEISNNQSIPSSVEEEEEEEENNATDNDHDSSSHQYAVTLHNALLEAIMYDHSLLAIALLSHGANPNHAYVNNRMSKTTDRRYRRKTFTSGPLHLASIHGNHSLVRALVRYGCKSNVPDSSGSFPIHLACSRSRHSGSDAGRDSDDRNDDDDDEDYRRTECVRILLEEARVPIAMKDGNKQTILHSAARSGFIGLLRFVMKQWEIHMIKTFGHHPPKNEKQQPNNSNHHHHHSQDIKKGGTFDWRDRWFRTPVHWAILNGNLTALQILLEHGCHADPPKPKANIGNKSTNAAIETPLEMCNRLYGNNNNDDDGTIGEQIRALLLTWMEKRNS